MPIQKKLLLKTAGMLILGGLLFSCQDTIPNRSTISPDQSIGTGDEVEDPVDKILRPSNAILFQSDFCGCQDGKVITYGNCAAFCATKPNTAGAEIFYANFSVTEEISLSGLGSVYGWCTAPLPEEETIPKCIIEAKDDTGTITSLDVVPITDSNSITSSLDQLDNDKTYVLTLVESVSGARSNSVQIVKFSAGTPLPILGVLKNAPITQYACLVREFSTDTNTGDIYYDSAYRVHFYFLPRIPPAPIPAGQSDLICHDVPTYGTIDDVLFPRLEAIPGVFNLWDTSDPRFYDNDGNTIIDVNDVIAQKTSNFGGSIPTGTNFFLQFFWPGSPTLSEEAGNTTSTQPLGYYMAPWIDSLTFKSYCLNSTHYNSTNALFKAMRDIISVDTEGLYIGEKAAETVIGTNGPTTGLKDYILIRETDLKQVWFYLNNGVPTAPTDANVANVPVYFYYPLNFASPFVKSSTQRIFQVKGANELNNASVTTGGANSTGASTTYPPHDRKIGCVPKF